MAYRLFRIKSLSQSIPVNWNQYTTIYVEENDFEKVVCKMVAILSQALCVNAKQGIY